MSYCRWSCDDMKSDLYVYGSIHGNKEVYIAHVAGRKKDWTPPFEMRHILELVVLDKTAKKEFAEKFKEYNKSYNECNEWRYNKEPSLGWSFTTYTAGEMLKKLEILKNEGYHVPKHAIMTLEEEIIES